MGWIGKMEHFCWQALWLPSLILEQELQFISQSPVPRKAKQIIFSSVPVGWELWRALPCFSMQGEIVPAAVQGGEG